jgi:hypothetical protein
MWHSCVWLHTIFQVTQCCFIIFAVGCGMCSGVFPMLLQDKSQLLVTWDPWFVPDTALSFILRSVQLVWSIFILTCRLQLKCDGTRRRGNWRMDWVASTLHTTSEHGVFSITTAGAHTEAASNLLNWRPRRFKWNRPFRRKAKSGFCACAITFQLTSTSL